MATHTALHIQSPEVSAVTDHLQDYLTYTHRPRIVRRLQAETFGSLYGSDFLVSEAAPTMFAIAAEQPGWVTAHYNSFRRLRELAEDVSRQFGGIAIVVMGQSVSDAYYISVFRSGEHLRTLEFADGEWRRDEGTPLPFESNPLGTN